jgi:putative lipoprotein
MAAVLLGAAALLAGCGSSRSSSPAGPVAAEVTGTVALRERVVLLPDTQLRITLNETSRADAPARFIAETTIPGVTRVPVAFRVRFDPRAIDPKLVYTLTARLERADRVLFVNDTQVPVLTRGAPREVAIVVVPASGRR